MTRTIVANLGCERQWAHQEGSPRPPRLPADIAAEIARKGVALAALAEPGDRLWLPADPGRVYTGGIEVITGALPDGPRLPWGTTDAICGGEEVEEVPVSVAESPIDWLAALWSARTTPAVAARVNHRGFADALARERGWEIEGTRAVISVDELRDHLTNAPLGPGNRWVARAPLSAAGRESIRRRGRELEADAATHAERLLRRQGSLTVQPWLEREADLSVCGIVADGSSRIFSPHRALCDAQGVVRALCIDDRGIGIADELIAPVTEAAEEAAVALRDAGYRGAFSVDAFVYRSPDGPRVHPLSEINARLTFGLVARAIAERSGAPRVDLWL